MDVQHRRGGQLKDNLEIETSLILHELHTLILMFGPQRLRPQSPASPHCLLIHAFRQTDC